MPSLLNKNQICYLNVLRFLSCLIVFTGHYFETFINRLFDLKQLQIQEPLWGFFFHLPGLGVMIFFVLSGFLITYSTLLDINKEGYFSIKRYTEKRCYRIFPPLWAALLFTIVIYCTIKYFNLFGSNTYVLPGDFSSIREKAMLPIKEILHNFILIPGATGGFNGPLWSLSYEFFYYILFSIAMVFIINRKLLVASSLLIAVGLAIFTCIFINPLYLLAIVEVLKFFLVWLLGALTAFFFLRGWIAKVKKEIFLFSFLFVTAGFFYKIHFFMQHETAEWFLYGLVSTLLICYFLTIHYTPHQVFGFLAKGSQYTYTLYLIHFPLCLFALSLLGYRLINFSLMNHLGLFVIIFSSGIILSYYMAMIFEDRLLMKKWATRLMMRPLKLAS